MYARSTTTRGNPQQIDSAIAYIRDEVMPAVQAMDGCIGMSMLADRDSGRCIATTAWESEEAMHNSESGVRDMRMRYAEMMGASPEVQEWEIAVLHRKHNAPDGAACRVLWGRGDPANAEQLLDTFRTSLLPRLEELPGFCSVSMMVNRESGLSTSAVVYETRDAMQRATEMGRALREEFNQQMGSEITEVAEFDLAVAHLRVPETV
jgi:quinol monooxygenase YgiN